MEFTPFTLEEATDIAEDFEDLLETDFSMNAPVVYEVSAVLVCPYNETDKTAFITSYLRTKDKDAALASFSGNAYDVLLFAFDIDDESSVIHFDIRKFALQKGISYNFP